MKTKTNTFLTLTCTLLIASCVNKETKIGGKVTFTVDPKEEAELMTNSDLINQLLDSLNIAAAQADYKKYFGYYASAATFNGTDATENWDKQSFMVWAKPYFDKKNTWNFKSVKRNLHFGKHDDIAWFDELLSTQMKICRGSGVVVKQQGKWKIQQYVLSMTVPNTQLDKVIKLKLEEDLILDSLNKKP